MTTPDSESQSRYKRIVLVQYSSDLNGSAFSGLLLADGLRECGWEVHVAFGYAGPMEERYRQAGHRTYVQEHKSWLRRSHPLRFFKDIFQEWHQSVQFSELLAQVAPDVVYINTSVSLGAAIAARRQKIPCVWHLRELYSEVGGEMHAPSILKGVVSFIFKHYSSKIVVNSHVVAENLLGVKQAKYAEIIPNAVTSDFFNNSNDMKEARRQLGLPEGKILVGVPGTLRPAKGHAFLFDSISRLLDSNPDLLLVVCGSGEKIFVEELKVRVDQLGIQKNVLFTGTVTDMPNFYRACDLICIPSQSESFGRVVIEAFASGTPVIATAVGGMREIINDRVNGLLVQYGDNAKLAMLINEMLENKVLREQIAMEALKCAKEKYREEIYKQKICSLVSGLVAENAG